MLHIQDYCKICHDDFYHYQDFFGCERAGKTLNIHLLCNSNTKFDFGNPEVDICHTKPNWKVHLAFS
jgi:hypothetical protein